MDIYIGGVSDRNSALHGDIVVIQFHEEKKWKVCFKFLSAIIQLDIPT